VLPRLSPGLASGMSKVHKCQACCRRVHRAPYISLVDRTSRKELRYHGGFCSGMALARAQELGPDRVILHFVHPRATCGDAKGRLDCLGRCFISEAAA
jgi:hypothetical protein